MMRLGMLIDRRGWCYERTADGLINYHDTEHTWTKVCAIEPTGLHLKQCPKADAYRVGGIPLFLWYLHNVGFVNISAPFFPTVSSYLDLQPEFIKQLEAPSIKSLLGGIIYNDARMLSELQLLNLRDVPLYHAPDYVDPRVFYPRPELRPTTGPLRIGWAGSEAWWQGKKHVDAIERAVANHPGAVFVRQDREKDGQKSQSEMCSWLNGLDVYISLNDERTCTPVTQLEAVACGIPVLTTRCGELWAHVQAHEPTWIMDIPSADHAWLALQRMIGSGRDQLAKRGILLRQNSMDRVTWSSGEAKRATEWIVARTKEWAHV